jgi:flagellar hook-length control protein FliK
VEGHPIAASSIPIMPDVPAMRPDAMVEASVTVEKPFVAPSENAKVQVIVPTPAEPGVIREKMPVVSAERPVAAKVSQQTVATVDKPEEKAVAAAAHVVVAPAAVEASAPQALQAAPEVAAASAASARTEVIVETVNQIVEAVVGQILVTPGITHGECEIKILLKPTVLDGSEITMSAKDGTLTVSITPATQEASAAAAGALPRLEIALAEHAPAFHHVSVALQSKKGNRYEAV